MTLGEAVLGIAMLIIMGSLGIPIASMESTPIAKIDNVHINWKFSQSYENIDACNVTFDHAIPEGMQIICRLTGHDNNLIDEVLDAPAFGLGKVMANGASSYTVPVLCYPNGSVDSAQACSTQHVSGVQVVLIQMETTEFS